MAPPEDIFQEGFAHLIAQAAQLLCEQNKEDSWGTTRTSGNAIWALCDCGLLYSHNKFISNCLHELYESSEKTTDKEGVFFNEEVWDTSVALMAFRKGDQEKFVPIISQIVQWLYAEALEDNFKNEPWETLWGLLAFLESGCQESQVVSLIRRCFNWLFDRRTERGVLISPHYMGFLLQDLHAALRSLELTYKESKMYQSVVESCECILWEEFEAGSLRDTLWGNEPWSVGHVLLGIAESREKPERFFLNDNFNRSLLEWYQKLKWTEGGWVDLVDTSFSLIGLVNYYLAREVILAGGHEKKRKEAQERVLRRLKFHYEEQFKKEIKVSPIWNERRFIRKDKTCFIIMPFSEEWSEVVYRNLTDIMREVCEIEASRSDDIYTHNDIIEKIWISLNQAALIIADCTGRNPNVLYELGIAHTIGDKVILLAQKDTDIPFDLKTKDLIIYENSTQGYAELRMKLPQMVDAVLKRRQRIG